MKCLFVLLLAIAIAGCSVETQPKNLQAEKSTTSNPASETDAPKTDATPSGDTLDSPEFVIDVRSQEEWDSGHVERAKHIPLAEIADRIAEVTDDKNAKIVLYCAVGGRAGKAKTKLEELGFTNVENAGGFKDVKDRYK